MSLFGLTKRPLKVDPDLIRKVDLQTGRHGCTKQDVCCRFQDRFMKRMVGKYVAKERPFKGQIASAILDVADFDYEWYVAGLKKVHRGEGLRKARKADRAGFYSSQFVWKNLIPDIVEINTSKDVRSGGSMRDSYRRSVEEMGGSPSELKQLTDPQCPVHNTYCWGIFERRLGHRQGVVVTDEKLLGYVKFKRLGNLATYSMILGHGEYLKFGIMYRLHYAIMQWLAQQQSNGCLKGLEYVMYGPIDSGSAGLKEWKKRALFERRYLVLG